MSHTPPPPPLCTNKDSSNITVTACTLEPHDMVGLAFIAEAGFISLTALALFFLLIIRNIWRYHKYAKGRKWSLIQSPADAFVLSLFVADVLQAIGAALDVRWVRNGIVKDGGYCNAQGFIQELGETAVALAVLSIAIHTFVAVWIRKRMSLWVACVIIFVYWLFILLFVIISSIVRRNYFAPTPFWCWVNGGPGFRMAGEYVWLWIALVISVLVYVPLFLENMGFLAVDRDCWWKVSVRWRPNADDDDETIRKRPTQSSLAIIAYPVAYSIIVLPVSISRWRQFDGGTVPDAATFFSVFMHDMFGAVNVLLLLTTRTNRLLFEDPRKTMAAAVGALENGKGQDAELRELGRGREDSREREDNEDNESVDDHLGAGARG